MTNVEILKKARALITEPERHTTGSYAKDVSGLVVNPTDPHATCWCALGAIAHSVGADYIMYHNPSTTYCEVLRALENASGTWHGRKNIARFNDTYGHAEVLALFDRAIAAEEKKLRVRAEDERIAAQYDDALRALAESEKAEKE